jgi:two-component system chemotaxis response regulator CheB
MAVPEEVVDGRALHPTHTIVAPDDDRHTPVGEAGDVNSSADGASPPPLVVVGASAGGVEALRQLVAGLPGDLPACVLVVLHVPPDAPSALPSILRRAGRLPAKQAADGDPLRAGQILVAAPDHHLVVTGDRLMLSRGPRENGHRPAIDVLFRSAARSLGPRVLGLVLSGTLDDGAAGAVAVAERGGRVAVQDEGEALYPSMPRAAAAAVPAADRRRVGQLAELVVAWAHEPRPPAAGSRSDDPDRPRTTMDKEIEMAELHPDGMHDPSRPGTPSGFGCPDCAGALFEITEGRLTRYRCRVGHAWSAESLLARQSADVEGALWMALRSLEEKATLNTELADRADGGGHDRVSAQFRTSAREALDAAELVRRLIGEIGVVADARAPAEDDTA